MSCNKQEFWNSAPPAYNDIMMDRVRVGRIRRHPLSLFFRESEVRRPGITRKSYFVYMLTKFKQYRKIFIVSCIRITCKFVIMPIFFLNMHSKISSVTTKRIELEYITFKPILEELFNKKTKSKC